MTREEMIRALADRVRALLLVDREESWNERLSIASSLDALAAHLPAGSEAVKPDVMKGYLLAWSAAYAAKDGGNDAVLNAVHAAMPAPPSTPPATNVQEDLAAAISAIERADRNCRVPESQHVRAVIEAIRSKQAPTIAVPDDDLLKRIEEHGRLGGHRENIYRWSNMADELLQEASEVLRAQAEQREAPSAVVGEDMMLVPREPTDRMTSIGQKHRYNSVWSIGAIYRAMLAAAPTSDGR